MSDQSQEQVNSQILLQLELVRRDLSRVEVRLGELVSLERYTIEHAGQQDNITKLEGRVTELERARATMLNMILSSFALPVLGGILLYVLTK